VPDRKNKVPEPKLATEGVTQKTNTSKLAKFGAIAARAGLDWFLLALFGLIGLAYLFPNLGGETGPLPLGTISSYGVSAIFFFYGLRLSSEKLKAGLHNWHLHVIIQGTTFLIFPGLVLAAQAILGAESQQTVWLGIFYLAALPSTVSSSVVMVSIAGGNLPAAIFNASISSLLGVFLTPVWMGWYLQASTNAFNFWPVIGKLTVQVLLPVVTGILLHGRFGGFAERYRQKLRLFDQTIILIIVFNSFCESFAQNLFSGLSTTHLVLLSLGMAGLFLFVMGLVYLVGRLLKLNRENQITALFCSSKKSLVHGTVMSKVLFPDAAVAGLVLLPIMVYHALQLIMASIIAQAIARRTTPPKTRI